MKRLLFLIQILILPVLLTGQTLGMMADYLRIKAKANDPLYTTYSATMARSRLYGDKAYKMDYSSDCNPISYSSDHAGKMFAIWRVDGVVILNIGEYLKKPIITYSFPDMMIMEYEPFRGIHVKETFLVFSSKVALVDMEVKNGDNIPHEITVYPILELGNDSLEIKSYNELADGYVTNHYESPSRLFGNLNTEYPYPLFNRDFFTTNQKVNSYGGYSGDIPGFYNVLKAGYNSDKPVDSLNMKKEGFVNLIALQLNKRLRPGETADLRYMHGVQSQTEIPDSIFSETKKLKTIFLKTFFEDNLMLFGRIPRINFKTEAEKLVYISSFNLVRGSMYPASGQTKYNFYSFSKNPLWGSGHGFQDLHGSLSMLSYVYLDPLSAEGSQRVYMEQQDTSGRIGYRHGPHGIQNDPDNNMAAMSPPFFSWINWEVYKVSKDKQFLNESYAAGSKYLHWLIRNRDSNHNGTFEWGPDGTTENIRNSYNAVFQVSADRYLDVNKDDISDDLECLDLTLMVIKEERSLFQMAFELGKTEEAKEWKDHAEKTSKLVNERMWDDSTGFYYSVNKNNYSFKFMTRDLKRQEIIGFLALWAEVAPKDRADQLLKALTDTTRFWRKYGVPSLSAQDPFYCPYVDYSGKWNGSVWVLWNYRIYDGLKKYGYNDIAKQLASKMMLCITTQLSKNHNFWESFSPDNEVLNCPPNYIWDSIMAKLLVEENTVKPLK